MPTKKIYKKRTFLNKDTSKSAYVIAEIESEKDKDTGKTYNYATIYLHDCSRKVTLDFHCNSKQESKACLAKAKLLQKIITEFTEALEKHITNGVLVQK